LAGASGSRPTQETPSERHIHEHGAAEEDRADEDANEVATPEGKPRVDRRRKDLIRVVEHRKCRADSVHRRPPKLAGRRAKLLDRVRDDSDVPRSERQCRLVSFTFVDGFITAMLGPPPLD
jgi:hypothetical protein